MTTLALDANVTRSGPCSTRLRARCSKPQCGCSVWFDELENKIICPNHPGDAETIRPRIKSREVLAALGRALAPALAGMEPVTTVMPRSATPRAASRPAPEQPSAECVVQRNDKLGIEYTPGFKQVRWEGHVFGFTPKQAAIVAALVAAATRGFPYVDQRTLLQAAGSEGERLHYLFQEREGPHPAWNTWIVSATPVSKRARTFMLAEWRTSEAA